MIREEGDQKMFTAARKARSPKSLKKVHGLQVLRGFHGEGIPSFRKIPEVLYIFLKKEEEITCRTQYENALQ